MVIYHDRKVKKSPSKQIQVSPQLLEPSFCKSWKTFWKPTWHRLEVFFFHSVTTFLASVFYICVIVESHKKKSRNVPVLLSRIHPLKINMGSIIMEVWFRSFEFFLSKWVMAGASMLPSSRARPKYCLEKARWPTELDSFLRNMKSPKVFGGHWLSTLLLPASWKKIAGRWTLSDGVYIGTPNIIHFLHPLEDLGRFVFCIQ